MIYLGNNSLINYKKNAKYTTISVIVAFSLILYLKGITSSIFLQPVIYFTSFLFLITLFILTRKNSNIKRNLLFIGFIAFVMFYGLILQSMYLVHVNGFLNEFGRIVFPFISTFIALFFLYKFDSNKSIKIIINIIVFLLFIETLFRIIKTGVYFPSFQNRYLAKGGGVMFIDSNFTGYIAGFLYLILNKYKNLYSTLLYKKVLLLVVIFYSMSYSVFAALFISFIVKLVRKYKILTILGFVILPISTYYLYNFISKDGSFLTKIEIIDLSINYIETHSLSDIVIGIGAGNFSTFFSAQTDHGAHNFIGMIIEGGLIFLIANIILYVYLYQNKNNRLPIIFLLLGGIVSMYPLAYMAPIYVLLFYQGTGNKYES